MMKSFTVKRSFDEPVTVIKSVYKNIEVGLTDITDQDIRNMKFLQLQSYARAIRVLLNEVLASRGNPQPITEVSEASSSTAVPTQSRDVESGKNCGAKLGDTSKYHYVFWDSNTSRWRTTHMSGSFTDEVDAALAADEHLDETHDNKRPRNRDEFPEIMKLYLEAQNEATS